jgi:hypothetical protein
MTAGDLRRGFEKMPRPYPAAVLFGLDATLESESVVTLTWEVAKAMNSRGELSEYAVHILKSQPVHITSPYVFWIQRDNKPQPLFDLDYQLAQTFGLLWGELAMSCERLIWIDEDADGWSWSEQWTKHSV